PHDLWKFFQFQCILSNFGTIPHDCRHFINIKRIFEQRVMKLVKGNGQSGIQNMLSHYNLTFEGQKHCGLDDSINIARLCIKLMQDKIELRINQRMTRRQDRNEERRLEELAKSDRADASDYHIWHRKLPLKLRQVTREILSEEYLDCDMYYGGAVKTLAVLMTANTVDTLLNWDRKHKIVQKAFFQCTLNRTYHSYLLIFVLFTQSHLITV
ncbi:hypothetical protein OSTOST_23260, partial [Ostertagia ostertagi]